jgi:hypothetical protein
MRGSGQSIGVGKESRKMARYKESRKMARYKIPKMVDPSSIIGARIDGENFKGLLKKKWVTFKWIGDHHIEIYGKGMRGQRWEARLRETSEGFLVVDEVLQLDEE